MIQEYKIFELENRNNWFYSSRLTRSLILSVQGAIIVTRVKVRIAVPVFSCSPLSSQLRYDVPENGHQHLRIFKPQS